MLDVNIFWVLSIHVYSLLTLNVVAYAHHDVRWYFLRWIRKRMKMANKTSHLIQCNFSTLVSKIDTFIFVFISCASVLGHSIIFVAYSRHRVLRNTTNVFLISLSASDVIVAVLSVPITFGVFLCHLLLIWTSGCIQLDFS